MLKKYMLLLIKFVKKSPAEKALYLEALFWLGASRVAILILPFRYIAPSLGKHMAESEERQDIKAIETAGSIARAINTVSRHVPWECKCLVQAVAGSMMLKKCKIAATLYLGVAKDENREIIAHAWLRSGDKIILGGGEEELNRFAIVSTFAR